MRFGVEWLEAPGVRDRVLAATWARLEITAGGEVVSDVVALDSRRKGVYGPVLPLVAWIVENWWNLLHEPSPISPLTPGRSAPDWMRPWVQRHNLLVAREGMALPDATFARDGDDVVVMWVPDPPQEVNGRVRFVGSGLVRVAADEFSSAAADLIERTLARIEDVAGDCGEQSTLAEAWSEIQSAQSEEQFVCRSIALLGGDPYDSADASDCLLDQLTALQGSVPHDLLTDLLEGTSVAGFADAAHWIDHQREFLELGARAAVQPALVAWHAESSAHAVGYRAAREARKALRLSRRDPITDLQGTLVEKLGWDADVTHVVQDVASIDGLVGFSRLSRKPILLGRELGQASARFRIARAAFYVVMGSLGAGRLLTRAATRPQRAGRAFAAEFLAPAEALAERVKGRVGDSEVEALADEFNVSTRLIEHQIENHGIGHVAP